MQATCMAGVRSLKLPISVYGGAYGIHFPKCQLRLVLRRVDAHTARLALIVACALSLAYSPREVDGYTFSQVGLSWLSPRSGFSRHALGRFPDSRQQDAPCYDQPLKQTQFWILSMRPAADCQIHPIQSLGIMKFSNTYHSECKNLPKFDSMGENQFNWTLCRKKFALCRSQ